MSTRNRLLRIISTIGLVFSLVVSMSACSTSWKEEVQLHDGSKIIVERSVDRGGRHEIGQQSPIKNQSLSFTLPSTNEKVKWEDNFTQDVGGANFLPMLLETRKDTAYLVVNPMGCLSYNKWGRPNPPYVVFKYQNKEWKRIPLQEIPTEIQTPNLIFSSPDDEAEKIGQRVVSAETIKRLYADYKQPEFKTILREPIRSAGEGCGEMIRVNDGWEGTGFFSGQPSYEACLKYCEQKEVPAQNCPCNRLFKGK